VNDTARGHSTAGQVAGGDKAADVAAGGNDRVDHGADAEAGDVAHSALLAQVGGAKGLVGAAGEAGLHEAVIDRAGDFEGADAQASDHECAGHGGGGEG